MPISTLKSTNNSFANLLMYILSIIGVIAVIYFASQFFSGIDVLKKRSSLTVDVYNGTADVFVNDQLVGKTPFSSKEIAPGDNKVKIKGSDNQYNTQMDFLPNDKKYIHNVGIFADLGTSAVFSSSQEFWFQKNRSGDVLKIISDPADASIFIDNTQVGKTPYSSNQLSDGEYDLRIDLPGYETQTVRINIKKGYTLNIRFKLFPVPVPANINLMEGATDFYNLSSDTQILNSDTQAWVKSAIYWNKTRGLNIAGTGLNKEQVFDYFVDYKGNLFDANGTLITGDAEIATLKAAKKGGYLGRNSDGPGVTQEAKNTILKISAQGLGGKNATILQTGTGWLRVRQTPGLSGTEVARVNVDQKYPVLEEQTGWVKIKVSETVTGWVSADFVKLN
jgi:hypothetical protein